MRVADHVCGRYVNMIRIYRSDEEQLSKTIIQTLYIPRHRNKYTHTHTHTHTNKQRHSHLNIYALLERKMEISLHRSPSKILRYLYANTKTLIETHRETDTNRKYYTNTNTFLDEMKTKAHGN